MTVSGPPDDYTDQLKRAMFVHLSTTPDACEPDTAQGQLAEMIETGFIQIDEYDLSANDRAIIVRALRRDASAVS